MTTPFRAGVLAAFFGATPVFCQTLADPGSTYVLRATSDTRSYGLWVSAPEDNCRMVRYAVRSGATLLGHSPPLRPGDGAVIRIGRGFSVGEHVLDVTGIGAGIGCDAPPAETRRVLLGKTSPDHSWLWK